MFKLTKGFKGWLAKNCEVPEDANDDAYQDAAAKAISDGKLTMKQLKELTADEKPNGLGLLEGLTKSFETFTQDITARMEKLEKGGTPAATATTDDTDTDTDEPTDGKPGKTGKSASEDDTVEKLIKGIGGGIATAMKGVQMHGRPYHQSVEADSEQDGPEPVKLFTAVGDTSALSGKDLRVRVIGAAERYGTTKTAAVYTKDTKHTHLVGQQVYTGENGRHLDHPSELDKAISGAWFKYAVNIACKGKPLPHWAKMTEHDNNLVQYALHNVPFVGSIGANESRDDAAFRLGTRGEKLTDVQVKALLDDTVSGGLEAAPIVFDDALILFPLLHGEIFPLVSVVNLTRGRRIEGFSLSNPTLTWGTAEGTSIALFDTSSFIAAFDTTIFNCTGAMEIGKDFEDDSPVNIGEVVIQRYGEQFLATLDEQVVVGDGTTEPEGVFTATGTTDVASDNGAAGPPTLSDYEGLLFGVAKQYRPPQDRARCIYVSNETSYRRSRGMKVDPAAASTDERRLLGLDHENYMTLGHPHKINEQIPNAKIGFFNARRYRMYRRMGLQVQLEEGGKELVRRNMRMIVVRARFGGQLEDGAAMSFIDDAQS